MRADNSGDAPRMTARLLWPMVEVDGEARPQKDTAE